MITMRSVAQWIRKCQLPLLLGAALAALILGYIGLDRQADTLGERPTFLDLVYRDFQLFALQWGIPSGSVPWELDAARFLAPAVGFVATVGAVLRVFRSDIESWRIGRTSGHVVICGFGYMGSRLAQSLHRQGWKVVVIDRDPQNEFLAAHRESGGLALVGEARNPDVLRKARVHRAAHVICVSGSDAINAEVAVQSRGLFEMGHQQRLDCLVHLSDPSLRLFLPDEESVGPSGRAFVIYFFNVIESGARHLLDRHRPFLPDESNAAPTPRLVFVGTSTITDSLIIATVRRWRTARPGSQKRFEVTLAGANAAASARSLTLHYPSLGDACEIHPCEVEGDSPGLESGDFLFDAQGACIADGVYVGLDDGARGCAVALALNQRLSAHAVPVVAAMTNSGGLASLLSEPHRTLAEFKHVRAVQLLHHAIDNVFLLNEDLDKLARAIHADFLRQHEKTTERTASMVPWDRLPRKYRQSNRKQALHIPEKLKAVGCELVPLDKPAAIEFRFTDAEVELLAEMEHERWNDERFDDDWIYAPVKNDALKQSPYLVDWNLLKDHEKEWDREFVRGIPKFVAQVEKQVARSKPPRG